nr:DMT family transporter [uncultured Methanoregula sp.]
MFWGLLSAIAACSNAGYYIANKKFLKTIDPDILAAAGFLGGCVFILPLSFTMGIPALGPLFFPAVLVTTVLNIIATLLTFRALQSTDISLAIPMISFTPIFLVGTSALILHEVPSAAGIAGIIIIVIGSYILNTTGQHTRITDPFRAMAAHPGVLAMLCVAFLYAVAVNFDKMVVENSDVIFGGGIICLLLGSSFVLIALLRRRGSARTRQQVSEDAGVQSPAHPFSGRAVLGAGILIGLMGSLEIVAINTAYTEQIVPYVIAIKRMSIILIVLCGTLVFREKEIAWRLSGAGLMVCGAALILLFP